MNGYFDPFSKAGLLETGDDLISRSLWALHFSTRGLGAAR
jgi:hypothetical protein